MIDPLGRNNLLLGADAPTWAYSTAPLAGADGRPVAPPTPGAAGYALSLSDQQARRRGAAGGCAGLRQSRVGAGDSSR